jgi:hypothetical protein
MSFTRNRRGGAVTAIWAKFREADDTPECQVSATPFIAVKGMQGTTAYCLLQWWFRNRKTSSAQTADPK